MSWLDIALLVVIGITALVGLKIGIIKAVLTLIGVVVGVILAGRFYVALAGSLTFIPQETLARVVAFAIILIGVVLLTSILAGVLKWLTSIILLGWVNRLGGALLGLIMGAIFCGALLAIWTKFLGIAEPIAESALATFLLDGFPMVLALLPDEFDSVRSFFQ
ncbi:MAG TPA: CvpA family protein [Dehalococcoidia bacterium]|nr:CvpA family protein [Dehalococcoidia bacterium]